MKAIQRVMDGAADGWQRGRVAVAVLDVRTLHSKGSVGNARYQAAYKRGEQRQKASRTPLVGRQWQYDSLHASNLGGES